MVPEKGSFAFGALEGGEGLDGAACLLLGNANVVEALKVEPELGARSEEVSEALGRVAGDGAAARGGDSDERGW